MTDVLMSDTWQSTETPPSKLFEQYKEKIHQDDPFKNFEEEYPGLVSYTCVSAEMIRCQNT